MQNLTNLKIVGNRGEIKFDPGFLMMSETLIRGIGLMNFTKKEMRETAEFIEQMADSGILKPVLGEKYRLENAQQAHIETIEKSSCLGKKYFDLQ